MSEISKEEFCNLLSVITIKNDCETLKALSPMMKQPIISLNLLPYYALFCISFKEYASIDSLNNESIFKISDIRNKLKLFSERYRIEKKRILLVDDVQDDEFKSNLRFKFLGKHNLYYNIGIFFDKENHIISNTQQLNYMFQDRKISHKNIRKIEVKRLGKTIGTIINSVSQGLQSFPISIPNNLLIQTIDLHHKDLNTNKNFNSFPNIENGKELTLRVLHVLSLLNFIRFVLGKIVPNCNTWTMRTKYIAMYYASKSIEHIIDKLPLEQANVFSKRREDLLNSQFRSCMMHYSFFNKGNCEIKDEFLNISTPLFGLVESCFNGMSYNNLIESIDKEIVYLAEGLESILKIDL